MWTVQTVFALSVAELACLRTHTAFHDNLCYPWSSLLSWLWAEWGIAVVIAVMKHKRPVAYSPMTFMGKGSATYTAAKLSSADWKDKFWGKRLSSLPELHFPTLRLNFGHTLSDFLVLTEACGHRECFIFGCLFIVHDIVITKLDNSSVICYIHSLNITICLIPHLLFR